MHNEPEKPGVDVPESGLEKNATRQYDECSLSSLEKVRTIFTSLSKYINSKKIYSINNPNLVNFAHSFRDACEAYFTDEEELLMTIEQYSISWRDQVVYENEKRDESIAFLLYKDGVGELSIHRPLVFEELEKFVDIIKDETRNLSSEVDIVTKLWRSDFECIRYRIFDEYFSGESMNFRDGADEVTGELVEADDHEDLPSFNDRGRIVAGTYNQGESIGEHLNHIIDEQHGEVPEQRREQLTQEMLASHLDVSSDESDYFEEALANERSSDMLVQFFAVILDFARIPGDSNSVGDVQNIITHLIEYFMEEFNVQTLMQVLGVIKKFIREHVIHDDCRLFFKHIEEQFTTPSMLLSLGRIAQRSKQDAKEVFRYYRLVGKKTVPTICALLEDSHSSWLHAEGCRAIITLAREDIHRIIKQMNMDKPRIAHDIVYILRELEAKEVHPIINELIFYPDASVKDELIELLVNIDSDEAVRLLVKLLDDEDQQIRMKTLKAVEHIDNAVITNTVMELAFDEDLELKNMEEQERIFRTVGILAGDRVFPQIAGMVRERNILLLGKKKSSKRKKILAIRALEHIGGPESSSLLEKLTRDSDDIVRKMAHQAVAEREERSRGDEGTHGPEKG